MNPFIPKGNKKIAIIDGRISDESVKILEKRDIIVIKTIKCKDVDEGISYHPDIVLNPIDEKTLIVAPNLFEEYYKKLSPFGINIIRGEIYLSNKYPKDISYNLGRINNMAIHNFKWTDLRLKRELEKRKIELIQVPQGYTKCSLAIIDNNAGITADKIIYEKLKSLGCDMILIEPGHIELPGFNYGFIGGCMGKVSEDEIIISGSLKAHPDYEKIIKFIKKYNKEIIYLAEDKLIDLGTIIVMGIN